VFADPCAWQASEMSRRSARRRHRHGPAPGMPPARQEAYGRWHSQVLQAERECAKRHGDPAGNCDWELSDDAFAWSPDSLPSASPICVV
jgi:hypothetical protein